ncbi:TetR/AcrR family transcriptional regulator [Paenibacillus sp. LS1]|uniref:TetR/AcrR family transcriptional regulator n=1 Tax=Paenibacillus sp. LS1 TaxID=2992120 RepID=UPI0022314941|nr:TetR/AcrR family transcriptional regulator [Paenibacillus sp. LS1]MCW3794439.1 TetR/AcrR family transcriptional regulator [Paenibacillus sp. LS1]
MKAEHDLRVLKTREHIKEGFSLCVMQKTFRAVTIKDISSAARVNRSTFYTYYSDKYELRDELVQSTLEELNSTIHLPMFTFATQNSQLTHTLITQHLMYLWSQKDWYQVLWNKNMELCVFNEMKSLLEEKIRKSLDQGNRGEILERTELLARLYASTAMSTLKWWYEISPTTSAAEVADIINDHWKLGMQRTFFRADDTLKTS